MNPIHSCLTGISLRRTAVRLFQAAALTLIVVLAIPARAADEREIRSRVAPVYPQMAKRMKITGAVKVQASIDPEGAVVEAKAISGNRMLSPAAEDAVRRWKFAPGASKSTIEVEINFALN